MEIILPTIANFAVMVFILVYFGRKPLGAYLVARNESVAAAMTEAEKLASEASKNRGIWESRISSIEADSKAQMNDAKALLIRQRDAALASAKQEAERIRREAELAKESEILKAKTRLENDILARSLSLTRSYLRAHLGDKDKHRMATEYVDKVGAQ